MVGGALRRTLVRIVRFFVVRPAALLGFLVVVVLLGAGIAFLPSAPALSALRPGGTEPQATGEYLRGNRDYNADLIWQSLSDDARQRLRTQGGSQEDLQRQMEAARQRGFKLEEVSYIGGKALPDGTSMQFYLVGVRQQTRADIDYQPYMFTLDRDGKIAKVQ
jgi:hypothetical protein